MVNFFTAFIVNNKESLFRMLNLEDFKKNKDSAAAYGKRVYSDQQYAVISANIGTIINYISTLDISLLNIIQSTYKDIRLVNFLDNAFADRGNFFKDYYCSSLQKIYAPLINDFGRYAFNNCTSLKYIVGPSINNISRRDGCFIAGCTNLEYIYLGKL